MPADDARRPRPHQHRSSTEILLAQRQQLGSHGTGKMGPFDHPENQRYADIDKKRAPAHREDRRQRHPQRQVRKGLDDFNASLNKDISPTTVIAGDPPDYNAECKAYGNTKKPDRERDPRPIDYSGQEVATQPIGTEQKQLSPGCRAGEMQVGTEQAPELILVAMAKETNC